LSRSHPPLLVTSPVDSLSHPISPPTSSHPNRSSLAALVFLSHPLMNGVFSHFEIDLFIEIARTGERRVVLKLFSYLPTIVVLRFPRLLCVRCWLSNHFTF